MTADEKAAVEAQIARWRQQLYDEYDRALAAEIRAAFEPRPDAQVISLEDERRKRSNNA